MTEQSRTPRTLFEKIWENHVVVHEADSPAVLYVDLHLVHEITSPQAFQGLREKGLTVRRPGQAVATIDHGIPTTPRDVPLTDELVIRQISTLEKNCSDFGIPLYGMDSPRRGIVHVIGPELGLTQPGMTIVCGDSHTSTHGAFGALAFGIGTSEVEHALATQCLLQDKPGAMEIRVDGRLNAGVCAKDIILSIIAQIGIGGATGHVIEYTGSAIRNLSMEQRMTVCNMSIEGGARAGMVGPDDTTFGYIQGRQFAPRGADWEKAVSRWRALATDEGARFDRVLSLNADDIEPMITFGTNPGMGMKITDPIPDPGQLTDTSARETLKKALNYMDLQPGQPLLGQKVDVVFIGSCTNSRLSDLRQAAEVMKGRRVSAQVRVLVVPGSQAIKAQAEAEGLDKVFLAAGAEWREAGCSMCIAMNGDQLEPGQYAVSTSNRNFEGRQGRGGRTFLASPLTAAASAINGAVTDIRTLLT
jgi:3-isopropylmalate/(R)-2-methylmalate dehydratase large subunit